ncbi:hypothetical protein TWF718_001057 [Orbilia javanica]|uniref:Uncharacterized protein n=1 Tax=Orbilia javanica TaxID=47235 RepID=A0AAN8RGY6_9PEZI
MEPSKQPLQNDGAPNRQRRHSDPSGHRSENPPTLPTTSATNEVAKAGPVVNTSNYMRAMAEFDALTANGYPLVNQPEPGSIGEISNLMQNCNITNPNGTNIDHAFLNHFGIPISHWSLQLLEAAKQTGDFTGLARIVDILDHFARVGRGV